MTEPRLSLYSSALTRWVLRCAMNLVGFAACFLSVSFVSARALFAQTATPTSASFSVPQQGYQWSFPRDHGAHRSFQTEWWYFTGHLQVDREDTLPSQAQQLPTRTDLGFQLTFFRRAVFESPVANARGDALLAHAAITDVNTNTFVHEKRYQRIGFDSGLTRADEQRLDVALSDWSVQQDPNSGVIRLRYSIGDAVLTLQLRPTRSIMLQGDAGLSRKGNCNSCASYYYSMPRLEVVGTIEKQGKEQKVHGVAWMDHEFMSNALEATQVGWDWGSLMTNDGDSIMFFRIRSAGDAAEAPLACTRMNGRGETRRCTATFAPRTVWQSPASGARYPSEILLTVDGVQSLIAPLVANQELFDTTLSYYEGAVASADRSVLGYLELTGYDKPLAQRF